MITPSFKPNCLYQIKRIKSTSQNDYRRKLMAMGLIPGAQFMVKRIAPFGGPLQLEINGSHISLRPHELEALLEVEPLS